MNYPASSLRVGTTGKRKFPNGESKILKFAVQPSCRAWETAKFLAC